MYLKNEDVKYESVENARGGKGTIRKTAFLTNEEMKENSRLFGKIIILPMFLRITMSTRMKEKPIIF